MVGGSRCRGADVARCWGGASSSPAQCKALLWLMVRAAPPLLMAPLATVALAWPPGHDCAFLGLAVRVAGLFWSAVAPLPGLGLEWPVWSGQVEVLMAREGAELLPCVLCRWTAGEPEERRSDGAVLGQWARVLRAQGTWLELRANPALHPCTKKNHCPHTLALLKKHNPKNL